MDKKDFPIHARWGLKVVAGTIFKEMIPFGAVFGAIYFFNILENPEAWIVFFPIIGFLVLTAIFPLVIILWREKKFLYSFDEKFVVLHQGIIYKAQRNVPYNVIQHVIINQDILDRFFRIATLQIENASEGGGSSVAFKERKSMMAVIGFEDNRIIIPGLFISEAEALKKHILEKMKKNTSKGGGL